jgi:hypothetical protein
MPSKGIRTKAVTFSPWPSRRGLRAVTNTLESICGIYTLPRRAKIPIKVLPFSGSEASMARDYDPRKWWEKRPSELSWETDRHAWFWYISQHWHYTCLSPQALVTWLALWRYANAIRWTVSGYPRSFFKGLPDRTGARSRAHRRGVAELVASGLIKTPRSHQYDLSPVQEFALKLHSKVEDLKFQEMLKDMDVFDSADEADEAGRDYQEPFEPEGPEAASTTN